MDERGKGPALLQPTQQKGPNNSKPGLTRLFVYEDPEAADRASCC